MTAIITTTNPARLGLFRHHDDARRRLQILLLPEIPLLLPDIPSLLPLGTGGADIVFSATSAFGARRLGPQRRQQPPGGPTDSTLRTGGRLCRSSPAIASPIPGGREPSFCTNGHNYPQDREDGPQYPGAFDDGQHHDHSTTKRYIGGKPSACHGHVPALSILRAGSRSCSQTDRGSSARGISLVAPLAHPLLLSDYRQGLRRLYSSASGFSTFSRGDDLRLLALGRTNRLWPLLRGSATSRRYLVA
jgi:hypothetical protein